MYINDILDGSNNSNDDEFETVTSQTLESDIVMVQDNPDDNPDDDVAAVVERSLPTAAANAEKASSVSLPLTGQGDEDNTQLQQQRSSIHTFPLYSPFFGYHRPLLNANQTGTEHDLRPTDEEATDAGKPPVDDTEPKEEESNAASLILKAAIPPAELAATLAAPVPEIQIDHNSNHGEDDSSTLASLQPIIVPGVDSPRVMSPVSPAPSLDANDIGSTAVSDLIVGFDETAEQPANKDEPTIEDCEQEEVKDAAGKEKDNDDFKSVDMQEESPPTTQADANEAPPTGTPKGTETATKMYLTVLNMKSPEGFGTPEKVTEEEEPPSTQEQPQPGDLDPNAFAAVGGTLTQDQATTAARNDQQKQEQEQCHGEEFVVSKRTSRLLRVSALLLVAVGAVCLCTCSGRIADWKSLIEYVNEKHLASYQPERDGTLVDTDTEAVSAEAETTSVDSESDDDDACVEAQCLDKKQALKSDLSVVDEPGVSVVDYEGELLQTPEVVKALVEPSSIMREASNFSLGTPPIVWETVTANLPIPMAPDLVVQDMLSTDDAPEVSPLPIESAGQDGTDTMHSPEIEGHIPELVAYAIFCLVSLRLFWCAWYAIRTKGNGVQDPATHGGEEEEHPLVQPSKQPRSGDILEKSPRMKRPCRKAEKLNISSLDKTPYTNRTKEGVKNLLRERGESLTGNKHSLVDRLMESYLNELEELDYRQLQMRCKEMGMRANGTMTELKVRLMDKGLEL